MSKSLWLVNNRVKKTNQIKLGSAKKTESKWKETISLFVCLSLLKLAHESILVFPACKTMTLDCVVVFSVTLAVLLISFALPLILLSESYRLRLKRSAFANADKNRYEHLNRNHMIKIPQLSTLAWQTLKNNLCRIIKTPDIRQTHWQLVELNENEKELRLKLFYNKNTLGLKPWQLAAHKIECCAKLKGDGVNSILTLCFTACSPMDYQIVRDIVEKSKEALSVCSNEVLTLETICCAAHDCAGESCSSVVGHGDAPLRKTMDSSDGDEAAMFLSEHDTTNGAQKSEPGLI